MNSQEKLHKNSGLTEAERVEAVAAHMSAIISLLGEDVTREGLVKTPQRAAKALVDVTAGYRTTSDKVVGDAIFEYEGSQMVIVRDIEFYSLCEHHVLPFFGRVSVGYIPDGKMIGLSKLGRLVDMYARRLQVQERLTRQIADAVRLHTGAKGVMVMVEAQHLCMKMRGVEKQDSSTTTTHCNGVFSDDKSLRHEFLDAIKR